jgi:hypothetical protein
LRGIGGLFGGLGESAVSQATRRLIQPMASDEKLKKKYQKLSKE